jgi:hypothetical protein
MFTPSHFLTLPGVCDVTHGLPFGPHPCNPFAFGREPKTTVVTLLVLKEKVELGLALPSVPFPKKLMKV